MHVITQQCCNDAACVPVCPVNCIHPTPDEPEYGTAEMLYIDPEACIDCGACIEVCPVDAIVADDDLRPQQMPFVDLNAQWYKEPSHQGYPVRHPASTIRPFSPPLESLRIAVVGAGPAGCYVVEHLLQQFGLDVHVNVFERLPVAGGLLRYGVAPDHQHTKSAGDAFERTLHHKRVSLYLNVDVGVDVTHDDLRQHHHAVVYAIGAPADRALDLPGEHLPGNHAASDFVAWYNGHPELADAQFDLTAERAVIVGNGNVALDVARVLTADVAELARTDIATHALEQLADSRVKEVLILGRRGPAQASFTIAELIGLQSVPNVDIVVHGEDVRLDAATARLYKGHEQSMNLYKVDLLREISQQNADGQKRIELRFLRSPVELLGDDRLTGLRVVHNELVPDGDSVRARATQVEETIDCGLLFRSIGYRSVEMPGIPFDPIRCRVPNESGRVTSGHADAPSLATGVYIAGWAKRGPSGVIGTNKQCALETVSALLADHAAGVLKKPVSSPESLLHRLAATSMIGASGWRAIDELERARGRSLSRPRAKLVSVEEMLTVARGASPG